eukprot:96396-Rhodomonas_salina.1
MSGMPLSLDYNLFCAVRYAPRPRIKRLPSQPSPSRPPCASYPPSQSNPPIKETLHSGGYSGPRSIPDLAQGKATAGQGAYRPVHRRF